MGIGFLFLRRGLFFARKRDLGGGIFRVFGGDFAFFFGCISG